MEKEEILLSILIATKNRVPYCINAIETILSFDERDFELIIQDNTDTLELKDYIDSVFCDERLIYHYTPPPFSSIENFNKVLEMANGKYVCLIGDDDGVCPQIIELTEWANAHDIDSVCPKSYFQYIWPGSLNSTKDATLTLPDFTGICKRINPRTQLDSFLRRGALDYLLFDFPKIYHGIIKKECLEEIKTKTGHYFGGLSPDIYAAVSLACTVNTHVIIDYPVTIAGACKQSTTIASINGEHSGKLENAPHFRDRKNYSWDILIPKVYSVDAIWAETALKAISELGELNLRKKFNFELFLIKNIMRNYGIMVHNIKSSINCIRINKKSIQSYVKLSFLSIWHLVRSSFNYANRRIFGKADKEKVASEVCDIKSATALATDFLFQNKIKICQ